MEALFQVCDPSLLGYELLNKSTAPREYIEILKQIAVPFDDMFDLCFWRNYHFDCSALFTEVITEEGFCYTFNMLDRKELFRTDVIDSYFYSLYQKMNFTDSRYEYGYEAYSINFKFIKT